MVPAAGTRRVGLEVAEVAPRSYAEQAGLAQGDVILEVGGKTVVTLPQVRRELQGSERPFISVVVRRSGRKRYLSIEVPR
jgi:S1-C subfamily serine protease